MKQDVAALEQKRQMLEQIVDITRAIECMQDSLNAVLMMAVASKDLSEEAVKLYSSLCGSMRNHPTSRINEYHENLEIIVKKQLNRILNYSGADFSSDEEVEFITLSSKSDAQSPVELLHAFKRTAQTAVSLRLLLRKRGVPTPGSPLIASTDVLKQQLTHLNQQEEVQCGRIKNLIEQMQTHIVRMIESPSYSGAMKAILQEVVENLDKDLQLLARGAPVTWLSFVAKTGEIAAAEIEEKVVEELPFKAVVPVEQQPVKAGFSKTAARWLCSPWEVSWDDLQQNG